MNILQRFIIPVVISLLATVITLIFVFEYFFNLNHQDRINTDIDFKHKELLSNIDRISDKALLQAASYSALKTVKNAMDMYYHSNNLDSASNVIKNKYLSLSSDFEKNTGIRFEMAFYGTDKVNIFTSWDIEIGRIINENQKILIDAISQKKSKKGVGVDKWGVAIFGVTPVYSYDSVFVGIVTIRLPLNQLLINSNLGADENMAVFIKKDYLGENNNSEDIILVNKSDYGDFVPVLFSPEFDFDMAMISFDFKSNDRKKHSSKNNLLFFPIDISDYDSNKVGFLLYQNNISKFVSNRKQADTAVYVSGSLAILLIVIVLILLGRSVIKRPVQQIIDSITILSRGIIIKKFVKVKDNEIGEINKALYSLNEGLARLREFAKDIGEGNLDSNYEKLSDNDEIGSSLIEMQKKLIEAKETEIQRKKDDENRIWANEGFVKFSELLRNNSQDIKALSDDIILNMVNYLGANQGGLFVANSEIDDDFTLDLISSYAYSRMKHKQKSISFGEGLVGTCAVEKESIFLTDVPDNYINITSGLGTSNPRSVLIVPLKLDEKVYGVIELASFTVFEDYQIEFVESVCDSIASTLNVVIINEKTNSLLTRSQQQAEELAAQEEELRQNMEELQATQEEAERKEQEMRNMLDGLKSRNED